MHFTRSSRLNIIVSKYTYLYIKLVTVEFVVDLDNGLPVLHTYIYAYIHIHVTDSIWGQNLTIMPLVIHSVA